MLKLLNYRIGIYDSLIESELLKPMILEILIFSIFSPPGIDYFFELETLGYKITYSIDDIFTFFTLLRLYTLLRLFGHHSIYTQSTAETICQRNGEAASSIFALKCFIQDSPFIGIGIVFFSIALFSSLSLKIAERPSTIYKGIEKLSKLETLADNM